LCFASSHQEGIACLQFGFDPDGPGLQEFVDRLLFLWSVEQSLSYKLLSNYSFLYSIPDLAGLKFATHFFGLPYAPESIYQMGEIKRGDSCRAS
jgi:hypothetical protein